MKIIITKREIKGTDKFLNGIMKEGREYWLEIKETKTSIKRRKNARSHQHTGSTGKGSKTD